MLSAFIDTFVTDNEIHWNVFNSLFKYTDLKTMDFRPLIIRPWNMKRVFRKYSYFICCLGKFSGNLDERSHGAEVQIFDVLLGKN